MRGISYDVRLYKTEIYRGATVTTYYVRWKVGNQMLRESYRSKAQAESFRSDLMSAARKGEAFSVETGRPVSWKRDNADVSWYDLLLDYIDGKWPYVAAAHRRSIAAALTDATEAMLVSTSGMPSRSVLRKAMRAWLFSARIRDGGEPPAELSEAVRWLARNTKQVTALVEPGTGATQCRAVLDRISRKLDGTPAAANTANRNRMIVNNLFKYAKEVGVLDDNPLDAISWPKPKTAATIDPRTVINPNQARELLAAVRAQGRLGAHLEAFFGVMYYAALRPEEAVGLTCDELIDLPDDGWGALLLSTARPYVGSQWTDDGDARQTRGLKHRAMNDTRWVPLHPDLGGLLRTHLARTDVAAGQRLFSSPRTRTLLGTTTYGRVWQRARTVVFGQEEARRSTLARRPYDLRHACVSTWLSAGVPAPQVAEWAGHSVDVLLRVYARCIDGQTSEALRRISDAT